MKRRITVLLILVTMISILNGCTKISNDVITIRKYKNLEIDHAEEDSEEVDTKTEELIWEALIENCDVKIYPKNKMEEYAEELKNQYSAASAMYGATEEQLIEADYGISLKEVVQNRICKELAVELIAEKEKIIVTDKEYQKGLEQYAKEYGYQDSEAFEIFVGEEKLRQILLQEEVRQFLVEHAKK